MGHKVNPTGLRLGIITTWKSRWFAGKDYKKNLKEYIQIREFVMKKWKTAAIADVEIERNANTLNLIIKTSRPGVLIGRGGTGITDMILIIDAMDLLYAGALDGFCIVSSDSDFTPLASRIRENGLSVYGFGKKKTPEAFKKACDKFIYIENLISDSDLKNNEEEDIVDSDNKKIAETLKVIDQKMSSQSKEGLAPEMIDRATLNLVYKAVKDNADENGWANLSMVGQYISAVKPDFDSRNYGRAKLSGLIKTLNLFETKIDMSQMYLRKMKKQSAS